MKSHNAILKLLASCLLAGILVNFGCEFYISFEQTDLTLADLQAVKISQASAPASNLFLFGRQPTEEENESHRCFPHQIAIHHLVFNHVSIKNLVNLGIPASGIRDGDLILPSDIIISQHKFII